MTRYQVEVTVLTIDKKLVGKERLADSFAKYFLMPASGLNRRFTEIHRATERGVTLADVCNLANLYQVSVQALVLRLEELSRLPSGIWERLRSEGFKVQQAQKLLGIDANPQMLEHLPRRYVALAVEAFRSGQLSEGQLTRYLHTDRVSVRALMESLLKAIHVENGGEFTPIAPDLAQTLGGR
jgi:Zn-dependent peptidase ImmA (M78 family)